MRNARRARSLRGVLAISLLLVGVALPGSAQAAGTGFILGRVFDRDTGGPISDATIVVDFPEPDDGSIPPQLVAQSGPEGDFEFEAVPAGFYGVSFIKSGYRTSVIANFEVLAGEDNDASFPMPPLTISATGEVMDLAPETIEFGLVGDIMNNLELRMESDQLVNLLSAEDLSKFAASDVADALKRVAGVNIVEGQFAIIRGLEDRYSSTLYNGAPIPSPDPDSQSVQLDLFPSDVVSNLNIGKSFAVDSPSNSAGGSINIITHDYPEELTFKASLGSGFNERTLDEFLRYDEFSPVGVNVDGEETVETDFSALIGGRTEFLGREFRFKAVAAWEIDYQTAGGQQGVSEPRLFRGIRRPSDGVILREIEPGGLSTGILSRTGPEFQLTESTREEQQTYYVGLGVDLDENGDHRIDGSYFFTKKEEETVQLRDDAIIPGFDYGQLDEGSAGPEQFSVRDFADHWIFDWYNPQEARGGTASGQHAFFSPIFESRTFGRVRELSVYQLNGDHDLGEWVDGLGFSWAANYAETDQLETTFNARYSLTTVEALGLAEEAPVPAAALPIRNVSEITGTPIFASRNDLVYSKTTISENQYFARGDLTYDVSLHDRIEGLFRTGFWFEQANRRVEARFLLDDDLQGTTSAAGVVTRGTTGLVDANYDPSVPLATLTNGPDVDLEHTVTGFDPVSMGRRIFQGSGIPGVLDNVRGLNRSKREVTAWNGDAKLTFWDDLDVIGGLRIENLRIEAVNDPYLGICVGTGGGAPVPFVDGDCPPGTDPPELFPARRLFLDRIDNTGFPDNQSPLRSNLPFNDQLINFPTEVDPVTGFFDCFTRECLDQRLRGEINETFFLPSVGVTYRPWDGWAFRFAYSQTVARPSFRELGYYASQESASDDFFVGNPSLTFSDVESFDGRIEWTFGDFGDLFAFSVFHKAIERPIEQVVIVDFDNADCTGVCEFRTFLNNQADAELVGIELEGRRTLDFLGSHSIGGFLETISVGGNFTYIDAEVERNPLRAQQSEAFFGAVNPVIDRYSRKRRLFGQPEWIANADVTFDHPDWGTKATLSVFAISEVLDAIGSVDQLPTRGVTGFALDRYTDEFYQMDLVVSQVFTIPRLPGEFTLKGSVKNLTDTTRKIIYDQQQSADDVRERSFRIGRDYSFALGYTFVY